MSNNRLNPAGLLASYFVTSKITGLFVLACLLFGLVGILYTPREENPQIVVPGADIIVELPGASPEEIDTAMTDFGFAMGPYQVYDLAGLDISWATNKRRAATRPAIERYIPILDRICEEGWFGRKTGRGFYKYNEGSRKPEPDPEVDAIIAACATASGITQREISDAVIIERCLYTLINEGARVLADGIALRASDIDLVWINGYGFPRWRGGPMFWAGSRGLGEIHARIKTFDKAHDFWSPAPLLIELAEAGESFTDWDNRQ